MVERNDIDTNEAGLWAAVREEWENTWSTYKVLEEKFGIKGNTIRSRRSREDWQRQIEKLPAQPPLPKPNSAPPRPKRKKPPAKRVHTLAGTTATSTTGHDEVVVKIPLMEKEVPGRSTRMQVKATDIDEDLTPEQMLFCTYYLKYFNGTKAYAKAYDTPHHLVHSKAHKLMQNPKVAATITKLKKMQVASVNLDAQTVLQRYIDIAFADITDFVDYGTEEVDVFNDKGIKTGTEERNYVRFRQGIEIDGAMVSEVALGKDGVRLKMHDKMKALDMLSKYFDLLDLETKKRLDEEKLKMEIQKLKDESGGEGNAKTVIITGEDQMRRYLDERNGTGGQG